MTATCDLTVTPFHPKDMNGVGDVEFVSPNIKRKLANQITVTTIFGLAFCGLCQEKSAVKRGNIIACK
eukprot:7079956-Ditylum_brightwellii.AAC.1